MRSQLIHTCVTLTECLSSKRIEIASSSIKIHTNVLYYFVLCFILVSMCIPIYILLPTKTVCVHQTNEVTMNDRHSCFLFFFLLFCSLTHHQRRRSKTQTESNHTQWLSKFFQVDVQFHDDKRTNKSKTFNVIHIWHESLSPTIAKKLITSNFTPDILTSQYETHKKAFFSSRQNNLIYTCKSIYGHFGYWCGSTQFHSI